MGTDPISRRRFLAASAGLLAAPFVQAQSKGKRPLIGVLSPFPRPSREQWARHEATVALAEPGWVEGTAKELGLAVPRSLLLRADRLIGGSA